MNNELDNVLNEINSAINDKDFEAANSLMNYYGILRSNLKAITDGSVPGLPRNNNVLVKREFDVSTFVMRTYGLTYLNTDFSKPSNEKILNDELIKVSNSAKNHKVTVVSVGSFINDLKPGDVIPNTAIVNLSAIKIPGNFNDLVTVATSLAELDHKDIEPGSTVHVVEYATVEGSSINYFIRD